MSDVAPEDHPGTNVRPFRRNGASAAEADGVGGAQPPSEPPVIRLVDGEIERIVDEAEVALIASGRGLYQRGGRIVSVGDVKIKTSDDREDVSQRIVERGDYSLVEDLTASATFQRFDGRNEKWATRNAPMNIAKTLRERGARLRLPVLTGLVNAPTLRPNGTLIEQAGYDRSTGLLFDPRSTRFPRVPDRPSRLEGKFALKMIEELFATMPFEGAVDRAVAVSTILTACSRNAYSTAPMHAITAPAAGTGKSMIVDAATMVATGRRAAVIALGKTLEETEKRLGGALLSGDPILALDNCETGVGGDLLCQILTQGSVRIRPLGASIMADLPTNIFVTATGNNLVVLGDMTRRTLICRINAKTERPELRVFDAPDPVSKAEARRGELVAAALTVLRSYIEAGSPPQKSVLGSFEGWSRTVRDAMMWLGSADPVASIEGGRRNDPTLSQHATVVMQWREVIGLSHQLSTSRIIQAAERKRGFGDHDFEHPDFRDALLAVAGAGGTISSRRLGIWLSTKTDRVVEGLVLTQGTASYGNNTWKLLTEDSPEWVPQPVED